MALGRTTLEAERSLHFEVLRRGQETEVYGDSATTSDLFCAWKIRDTYQMVWSYMDRLFQLSNDIRIFRACIPLSPSIAAQSASIVRFESAIYYWYTQALAGLVENIGNNVSTMKYALLPDNVMLSARGQSATIARLGVYWIEE